jgi:hypothetical protein
MKVTGAILLCLAIAVATSSAGAGLCRAAPIQDATSRLRIPVLLVGEPGSDRALWEKGGFLSRLTEAGYREGVDLFSISPQEPYPDLSGGSQVLKSIVDSAMSKARTGEIDVIAYGTSGLVLRYALEWGYIRDGSIRNLIMIGSPNRGTFVAEFIRALSEIVEQEAMLEKATRSARFIPFSSGPLETPELQRELLTAPTEPWDNETAWICGRAYNVYEPLYAQYVAVRHLSLPYIPVQSPKETFAGWIASSFAQFWQTAVVEAVDPPLFRGIDTIPDGGRMPLPGEDLSCAYYEILSMDVAKNLYVMRTASRGGLLESLTKDPYLPVDWTDALIHYGQRLLSYYVGKALITLKSQAETVISDSVLSYAGFTEGKDSPFLRRLIREDMVVNLGSSLRNRFLRVPANCYLADLNEVSMDLSHDRITRYVNIAGSCPNLWSLAWPQTAPNDLYCEVDSAIGPVGPKDIVRVFSGIFGTSHKGLVGQKGVHEYILSILSGPDLAAATLRIQEGQPPKQMKTSSWVPSHVDLSSGVTCLEFDLQEPPQDWAYRIWAENGEYLETLASPTRGGTFQVRVPIGSERVWIRLVRKEPMNPIISGAKVDSAFAREITQLVTVRGLGSVQETGGPGTGGNPGTGIGGTSWGGNLGTQPAPGTGDATDDPSQPDIPLIRAVYRTKRTTLKEPKETYHRFWNIDFGDGQRKVIEDQPELCLEHEYRKPGDYRVTAVSYDNNGKEILAKTWDITVTEYDRVHSFQCLSIRRQPVDLTLEGPQKWITGKPAEYRAGLQMDLLPEVQLVDAVYDPGERFMVLWERAGDFSVGCAVTVQLTYRLEDKVAIVKNTYLTTVPVTVLTTGVTN